MYKKLICSFSVVVLLSLAGGVNAAPVPVFHSTLNDTASVTSTGGVVIGGAFVPAAVPPGSVAKFQSTGGSTANWGTTETDTIFSGWDKTRGITVDLYFSGIGEAAGDVGLWSVGKRQGGDNFLILVARDDEFRFNIRDEGGAGDIGGGTHTILTSGVDLNPAITYRLTVRQHSSLGNGGDLEIFLESVSDAGAQYPGADSPIRTLDLPAGNFDFPSYDGGSGEPLGMRAGDKYPHFGGSGFELRDGDAVDNVRVFNGVYLPSELGTIPEPCTLLLLSAGALPLVRRRRP
ncbi:MAG: hypothetical protein JSU94_01630 [Phycisphaerales bacterium]|nr:MAG: hypothetical protein JSU94_01630 [Phycisphaerales bacterium]